MRTLLILGLFLCVYSIPGYAMTIDLDAICKIESNCKDSAIGDNGRSLGRYQIQEALVIDYNRANNALYSHGDMLKADKARIVAQWQFERLVKRYGNIEEVLMAWNWGAGNVAKWRGLSRGGIRHS